MEKYPQVQGVQDYYWFMPYDKFIRSNVLLRMYGAGIVLKDTSYRNSEIMTSTLFEYIIEGEGYIEYDGVRYKVKAGDCVIARDGMKENKPMTYYSSKTDPYVKLWFIARGIFVDKLFEAFAVTDKITIKSVNLYSVFDNLCNKLKQDGYSFSLASHTILDVMEAVFLKEAVDDGSDFEGRPEFIKGYVSRNLQNPPNVSEISSHFGMSEGSFQRYFKKEFGTTYHKFVMKLRLEQARILVENSKRPVAEIASVLGFCDQGYFSSSFKKEFGMYPSVMRKINKEKAAEKRGKKA